MYQLEYLDLEENSEYEDIIKKVVNQCFKEVLINTSFLLCLFFCKYSILFLGDVFEK